MITTGTVTTVPGRARDDSIGPGREFHVFWTLPGLASLRPGSAGAWRRSVLFSVAETGRVVLSLVKATRKRGAY